MAFNSAGVITIVCGVIKTRKPQVEKKYKILNIPLILFGAAHPAKRLPEIVIGAEEEDTDHGCLNNKQPGQQSAHQGDAHLLPIGIDLAHQPIASERQGNQERHPESHGDIAHPVIMSALFIVLSGQEPIGRIGCHDTAAKRHIAENAVHVQRIPQGRMDHVPDIPEIIVPAHRLRPATS